MSQMNSKSIPLNVQSEQDSHRSVPAAIKPTQTDQPPSEESYELSDEQLESVVGGLRDLAIIRIIGFEN